MNFNGHVLKHANRQHTTRDKHQKQIIAMTKQWVHMNTPPSPHPVLLLLSD